MEGTGRTPGPQWALGSGLWTTAGLHLWLGEVLRAGLTPGLGAQPWAYFLVISDSLVY